MRDSDVLSHASCSNARSDCLSPASPDIEEISGVCNSHLAKIGAELLKPPVDSPLSATSSLPAGATSLPAVPGAIFMVLTGFLCVSLVRDRKFWTAALVGLLWAGQAGFTVLPLLARYVASKKQTQPLALPGLNCTPELLHCDRARSDVEGTTYAGLLHYLAGIPNMSFLQKQESKSDTHLRTPQSAITEVLADILPATKRLACITKQHACFSPAFIFPLLARGPPLSAWECSLKR
jgi:hypothetical protein